MEGRKHVTPEFGAAPEACFQVPASLVPGIMSMTIETGQDGSKLSVRQHRLTLGIMAVDENGNGLEGDDLEHG